MDRLGVANLHEGVRAHAYSCASKRGQHLVVLGVRGGYMNLNDWRRNELDTRRQSGGAHTPSPYATRHTYAAFSIGAGMSLFALARRMGTSVEQIDKTYGHLLPDAADHERGLLDAYDAREKAVMPEAEETFGEAP